tara:strand:+ start:115 stop:684 length:570 start_codon:yes stop_codon:yes gene_type:complete
MKSLVVGLGNKGFNYKAQRHNVGSEIVSKICKIKDITLIERAKYKAKIGQDSNQVSYLIPSTYMNLSGQSVALFLKNKKIDFSYVFVIHDDIDLDVGIVRLKKGGGTGGHNGLKSLIGSLASDAFNRIRIGVGRPKLSEDVSDYVLSSPPISEKLLIDKSAENVVESIDMITGQDIQLSMNLFNKRNTP